MDTKQVLIRSLDELPLVLDVCDIQSIMKISKVSAYELVHTETFPVIMCGRRLKISKKAFSEWLDKEGHK